MWFSNTPAVLYLALGAGYRQVAGMICSLTMDTKSINLYNKCVLFHKFSVSLEVFDVIKGVLCCVISVALKLFY